MAKVELNLTAEEYFWLVTILGDLEEENLPEKDRIRAASIKGKLSQEISKFK